ncbi:glycosyltransferase family 2 protein [Paraburkholderia phenazinium]|uniref:Glycosyltransferase like family 2 n=1 Tax=Paraburkholderia phenazinium TaxID=60549 RepID=A0A1G7QCF4_9BURK|nr:glycosyltransferase family 2 protein [Paraburkholderia phenazinium]SDF96125.1 Glycosyltransferase like family 2 [Paraburkholderia phenazinium]
MTTCDFHAPVIQPIDRSIGVAPRICVGIATRGRPAEVATIVACLRAQALQPASIVVACTGPDDIGTVQEANDLRIVFVKPGLTRQRNAILDSMPADTDYVVFFDDDFVPHPDWLREAADAFLADPALACITGHVVADGILGPGLSVDDARRALATVQPDRHGWVSDGYSPYGCNMAFRASAVATLRFDERLVLYGWLEDRDFGARVAQTRGRLVKLGRALGVHLGVKRGRMPGRRLGYSQVMNPLYMMHKGTMSRGEACLQIVRNVAANVSKSIAPETYIDRRGRLAGNLIAFGDVLRGRRTPERAERL